MIEMLSIKNSETNLTQRVLGSGKIRTEGTHCGIRIAIDSERKLSFNEIVEHIEDNIKFWVNSESYVVDWEWSA